MMLLIEALAHVSSGCRVSLFFFQAEDGMRELVRSRGLGDVYKRQRPDCTCRYSRNVASLPARQSTRLLQLVSERCNWLSLIHI